MNEKEGIYFACHSPNESGSLLLECCVELTVQLRLATKSQSSCLCLPNAAVTGANYLSGQNIFDLYLSKMFSLILLTYCFLKNSMSVA